MHELQRVMEETLCICSFVFPDTIVWLLAQKVKPFWGKTLHQYGKEQGNKRKASRCGEMPRRVVELLSGTCYTEADEEKYCEGR